MRDPFATSSPGVPWRCGLPLSSSRSVNGAHTSRDRRNITYPCQQCGLVLFAQLPQMVVLLLLQIGVFFDLCLVEPVDDGVLPLRNKYSLDLS